MCWKYKNKHDHVFVWCDIANTRRYGASYLRSFSDGIEDYYSHYNYCPFCGKVLQIRGEESDTSRGQTIERIEVTLTSVMEIQVPLEKNKERYIDEFLDGVLPDKFKHNVEWDYAP